MFKHLTTAVFSGSAVTLGLLYVMQLLIVIQPGAESMPREPWEFEWLYDPPREDPPRTTEFDKPDAIKDPPEIPQTFETPNPFPGGTTVRITPRKPADPDFTMPVNTIPDGPLVALVRVRPVYPARAEMNGIEGYVLVEFTVGTDGTVSDVVVVDSSHAIFETSAVKAAERFRFKPRVIAGVALPTHGVQNLFRFRMEP